MPGLIRPDSINVAQPVDWTHPLNRGTVGWWLNLGGPPVKGQLLRDLRGRSHGTRTNGAAWAGPKGRPGAWGSVFFDGSDDYVDVGTSSLFTLDKFTVSAWVFLTVGDINCMAVAHGDDVATGGYLIYYNSGGYYQFLAGGGSYSTAATATVGQWDMLTATFDGTTASLYRGPGLLDDSPDSVGVYVPADLTLRIGRQLSSVAPQYDFPWNGYIDDVHIWNRALSKDDVQHYYDLSRRGYPGLLNRSRLVVGGFARSKPFRGSLPLLGVGR